ADPAQVVLAVQHHEHVAGGGDVRKSLHGGAGGRRLAADHAGQHVHPVGASPVGEGAAQSRGLHLLRGPLAVVPRHRTVHDATAGELRGADRALTGAAGALLAVRLAAAAGDLGAGLGLVRALAGSGQLGHHDLVDQRHVGGDVEDRRRQYGGALLGNVGVEHVDDLVVLGERSHRLHAPFTAVLTTTRPPLGPGTEPETSSRPFSASTAWMVRFWTVWRALPIRPAIRWPRNTRPGVAAPPMEPGLRWLRCAPWEAETPAKPCRFITPA